MQAEARGAGSGGAWSSLGTESDKNDAGFAFKSSSIRNCIINPNMGGESQLGQHHQEVEAGENPVRASPAIKAKHCPYLREGCDELCDFGSDNTVHLFNLQSLFLKLNEHHIRGDFLEGSIVEIDDPETMLYSIDMIKKVFLPSGDLETLGNGEKSHSMAAHLTKLLQGVPDILELPDTLFPIVALPYCQWRIFFNTMMQTTYWRKVQLEGKQVPTVEQYYGESPKLKNKKRRSRPGFSSSESCGSEKEKPKASYPAATRRACYQDSSSDGGIITLDELVITSSDSSDIESDKSCMLPEPKRSSHYRVVTPPPFNSEGHQSLKKYLQDFERYFNSKFHGGPRECAMELGKFLENEALAAYKAFDGPNTCYRMLKEKLLEWDKSREVHGTKRWQGVLKTMTMNEGESFKLLGLRVREVARKAYPRDKKLCVKKMLEKYSLLVPEWFNEKLRQRQDMKEMMKLGKQLNWNDVMKQAEAEDKRARDKRFRYSSLTLAAPSPKKNEEVWIGKGTTRRPPFSRGPLHEPGLVPTCQLQNATSESQVYSPQRHRAGNMYSQNSGRTSDYRRFCDWCGKAHFTEDCWFAAGACLICGSSDHMRRECPRYRPSSKRNPRCPKCNGPHLGMSCRNKQDLHNRRETRELKQAIRLLSKVVDQLGKDLIAQRESTLFCGFSGEQSAPGKCGGISVIHGCGTEASPCIEFNASEKTPREVISDYTSAVSGNTNITGVLAAPWPANTEDSVCPKISSQGLLSICQM